MLHKTFISFVAGLVILSTVQAQFADSTANEPQPLPRAVKLNFLKSMVLPGWGQYSEGHYKRAAAFAAMEAASILGNVYYTRQETRATTEFENYVDVHWSFDTWIGTETTDSQGNPYHCGYIQTHAMPYTDNDGVLLPVKDRHYYENVGKYNEFICGWDDFTSKADTTGWGEEVTPHKLHYSSMRRQANDFGKIAKHAVTVLMFNHIFSAFEAALGTKINGGEKLKWHATLMPATVFDRRGLELLVIF